jgi:hypothetical protein
LLPFGLLNVQEAVINEGNGNSNRFSLTTGGEIRVADRDKGETVGAEVIIGVLQELTRSRLSRNDVIRTVERKHHVSVVNVG